jgi:hypothetical protein
MIGAWREFDGESRVDSTGTLVDGTVVEGPQDLRAALMERSELFVSTFTEKLLTYALGRKLEAADMRFVRAIKAEAENQDFRFSAIINALVTNPVFQQRSTATLEQVQASVNPDTKNMGTE